VQRVGNVFRRNLWEKVNEKLGREKSSVFIVNVSCKNGNKMPKIMLNYKPNGRKTTWEGL
jgi:hypothetical protein